MTDDDYKKFFSPISPDAYVDLRVVMAIKYSRKKVPPNARLEFVFKILVVSLTIVGTVFSFIGMQRWLTVTVSLAGCCAAWNDFADYGRKSTRHTWTVQALEQTLTWWGEPHGRGAGIRRKHFQHDQVLRDGHSCRDSGLDVNSCQRSPGVQQCSAQEHWGSACTA